jgi:hypothetical protein
MTVSRIGPETEDDTRPERLAPDRAPGSLPEAAGLAGDVTGGGRGEERDGLGDLPGLAEAAQRPVTRRLSAL